jgi:hypothetical protein
LLTPPRCFRGVEPQGNRPPRHQRHRGGRQDPADRGRAQGVRVLAD